MSGPMKTSDFVDGTIAESNRIGSDNFLNPVLAAVRDAIGDGTDGPNTASDVLTNLGLKDGTPTDLKFTNPANTTQALVDQANVAWNMNLGAIATWTIAGNRVMGGPTNIKAGGHYVLVVTQDATGGRTISWNSAFIGNKGANIQAPNKAPGSVTTYVFESPDGVQLRSIAPLVSGPLSVVVSTASTSYAVPSGANRAKVYLKAAGASGAGSTIAGTFGGGGGEGEERTGWVDVNSGQTITITLNAGGAAVALNTNASGNAGGDSVWTNGVATITAKGASATAFSGNNGGAGGAGGNGGSGGDYAMPGAPGTSGADAAGAVGVYSVGGGKGGGSNTTGNAVANSGGGGKGGDVAGPSGAGATGICIVEFWN